jgi:hypothetical protein
MPDTIGYRRPDDDTSVPLSTIADPGAVSSVSGDRSAGQR